MYSFKQTDYGYRLYLQESLSDRESKKLKNEVTEILQRRDDPLGLMVDMRNVKTISKKANELMFETLRLCGEDPPCRVAVIAVHSEDDAPPALVRRLRKVPGTHLFNPSDFPGWEVKALQWLRGNIQEKE